VCEFLNLKSLVFIHELKIAGLCNIKLVLKIKLLRICKKLTQEQYYEYFSGGIQLLKILPFCNSEPNLYNFIDRQTDRQYWKVILFIYYAIIVTIYTVLIV